MASGSIKTKISEENRIFSPTGPRLGTVFVEGKTIRGPINDPQHIIFNFNQFQKLFGGLSNNTEFPLICKRLLDKGVNLRVNRIAHYTDITDKSTLTATKPDTVTVQDSNPNDLFDIDTKYAGEDYNNLEVEIKNASNGNSDYFNMEIRHTNDPDINELYENIKIDGTPTVAQSEYLKEVVKNSKLVEITYKDLSNLTSPVRPSNQTYNFTNGSDGGSIAITDYVGDQSQGLGLYAFDSYSDAIRISVPEIADATLHSAGASYASDRGDIVYYGHIPNSDSTVNDITTFINNIGVSNTYFAPFGGGLKNLDSLSGKIIEMSELGDIFANAVETDKDEGVHYSYAGLRRGQISNTQGVVNNFGSTGASSKLDVIANAGANMVINRDGKTYIWGNRTRTDQNVATKFLNIREFLVHLKKTLRPTINQWLQQPNIIEQWLMLYQTVQPTLDGWVNDGALYDYLWKGDQFADDLQSLSVNDPNDVSNGIYKIELWLQPVPAIHEINLRIITTSAGVDFSEQ